VERIRRFFAKLLVLGLIIFVIGCGLAGFALYLVSRDLPDFDQLADYQPATLTRVHAGDGRMLAELAHERRVFVPYEAVPTRVIQAFLSAEDKSFFSHPGVSLPDIARAAAQNIGNIAQGRRLIGASTITQQVAKNFILGNEATFARKLREALIALRLEQVFTKERILELYLNEIFLGGGSYGIAAAAQNYFNRTLDELTLAEVAYLAALPKAPNSYHPVRHAERARARRDWVLGRMREDGYITEAEFQTARAEPITMRSRSADDIVRADYFAEEVRRELLARFGEEEVYRGGLTVRSTLDPRLQEAADRALRNGLMNYDRRRGWRGPVARIQPGPGWERRLAAVPRPPGSAPWRMAVVLSIGAALEIGLPDGARGLIAQADWAWARVGEPIRVGDVVFVEAPGPTGLEPVSPRRWRDDQATSEASQPQTAERRNYSLRQIPLISGGIVALDPHTGRVLAMRGGWSFEISQFNRATQAQRQPGSSIKPFIYLAALENGFHPGSLVVDGPISIEQGPGLPPWQPQNYSRNVLGPTTIRRGVELSRNLMTVRLAQQVGIDVVAGYIERFGIMDRMPRFYSMSLGAGETTVMRMTTAYAQLVNGGLRLTPSLIDRVQDRNGRTIFRHDRRDCEPCVGQVWQNQDPPDHDDARERIIDPVSAYQIVNIMTGVIERGTATRLRTLDRPLAGKTGTTNDSTDAWFIGFTPDLVAGVYIGFDQPRSLGDYETGGSLAVPIFGEFMAEALRQTPATPFRIPPGARLVRVNPRSGRPTTVAEAGSIWEAFRPGQDPNSQVLLGNEGNPLAPSTTSGSVRETGGLY
jgi:penicillin-binding protein 1A